MVFQIWMPSEQYLSDAEFDAEFQQYIKNNIDTVRFDQKRLYKLFNIGGIIKFFSRKTPKNETN